MIQALTKCAQTSTLSQLPKCFAVSQGLHIFEAVFTKQPLFSNVHTSARSFSINIAKEGNFASKTAPFARGFWGIGTFTGVRIFTTTANPTGLAEQGASTFAGQINELKAFLNKKEAARTLDNRLQFIDTIFKVGDSQAEAIKGKHVIAITGTTNAGKSTFLNYMNGCEFIMVNNRVNVLPTSKEKEIVQIGRGMEPTTICPQAAEINREHFCDLPGFEDPRGFEVNIGICHNVKMIYDNAKTVRTVYLIDYHSIIADGGIHIPSKLQHVNEVFNKTLRTKNDNDNSFVIVITHAENVSPEVAIDELKAAAKGFPLPKVYVYDPMMDDPQKFNDRVNMGYVSRSDLWGIFDGMTKQSKAFTIQLKLSKIHEKDLERLGSSVESEMCYDLQKSGEEDLKAANHKLKFFEELKKRFNTDVVEKMQESAYEAFNNHVQKTYVDAFNTKNSLAQKYQKYAEYVGLKAIVTEGDYQESDAKINACRKEDATKLSSFQRNRNSYIVAAGSGFGIVGIANPLLLPFSAGLFGYAAWKYFNPSVEDKNRNRYFDQ